MLVRRPLPGGVGRIRPMTGRRNVSPLARCGARAHRKQPTEDSHRSLGVISSASR